MANEITHADAVVPSDDLTAIVEGSDIVAALDDHDDVTKEVADNVLSIIDRRSESVKGDTSGVIVVLDEWTYSTWSDYSITTTPLLIAKHIEDYSENAYKSQGTFAVRLNAIEGKSAVEVSDKYINNLIKQVDETDTDYINERGNKFIPKKAVAAICVLERDL
jgi:hypothetical protein